VAKLRGLLEALSARLDSTSTERPRLIRNPGNQSTATNHGIPIHGFGLLSSNELRRQRSLKHRLPELEASIDPAALRAAADEYSDLLLTLCLCMKMAGPTRANVRACASELKKRLTTWHSQSSMQFCPVGIPLAMFSASAVKRTTTRAQLAIRLMSLCEVNMRLINRSKQSPLGRQCDAALAKHVELYGAYGRQKTKRTYTVVVQGSRSL
jgi:hypothetical protein